MEIDCFDLYPKHLQTHYVARKNAMKNPITFFSPACYGWPQPVCPQCGKTDITSIDIYKAKCNNSQCGMEFIYKTTIQNNNQTNQIDPNINPTNVTTNTGSNSSSSSNSAEIDWAKVFGNGNNTFETEYSVETNETNETNEITQSEKHKCNCSKDQIFNFGCKCGGI